MRVARCVVSPGDGREGREERGTEGEGKGIPRKVKVRWRVIGRREEIGRNM